MTRTNGKSHTPIYGRKDLAELVSDHDQKHPDHAPDCGCKNGLIAMLRIYFAPVRPVPKNIAPYVPPDSRPAPTHNEVDPRKPWLQRHVRETDAQYDYRTSHSCYNCGVFIMDKQGLNLHEDKCSAQGKRAASADPEEHE